MLDTELAPWPSFTQEEIDAVSCVLASNRVNYWTGEETRRFEEEFAAAVGCAHAVAVANGTLALDLALKGLQIGPGDEVIVPARSFIACASCVVAAGAAPVFADVDPHSGNLSKATIEAVVTPRTKAIIAVHLAGWPCDMDAIMALAREQGLLVIEDCAQAHGALYKGRSVGSIGHVGAWSFCQDKIMSTGGEGGMVTTNDPALWSRMWSHKEHGKSWQAVHERHHPPGYRWLHESFGTNWRMTEMQAAIGRIQLRRLPTWSADRAANARALERTLEPYAHPNGPIKAPVKARCDSPACNDESCCRHAYYKYYAYVDTDGLRPGYDRDEIIADIVDQGIPCDQGTCAEVYRERAFADTPWLPSQRLPVAQRLGESSLMFLVHPTLTEEDMRRTCAALGNTLAKCTIG
ncbi:MAG: DegT/DnrJ/EryC1/StrS aminotransferase family protein [Pseudomonadota bacterium]